jgi:4a-hydroxytetrahydrobiopterin dehydratase
VVNEVNRESREGRSGRRADGAPCREEVGEGEVQGGTVTMQGGTVTMQGGTVTVQGGMVVARPGWDWKWRVASFSTVPANSHDDQSRRQFHSHRNYRQQPHRRRQPAKRVHQTPSPHTLIPVPTHKMNVMAETLTDDEITENLPEDWSREGDEIVRTFEFDSYLEGVGFASGAGGLAEEAFHHPEMTIGWCEVEVRLTTHDAGGITEKDIDLAERFDELAD